MALACLEEINVMQPVWRCMHVCLQLMIVGFLIDVCCSFSRLRFQVP